MTKPKSDLKTRVTTPKFRISFPVVFEPQINRLNGKNEFSIVMMFDKTDKVVMAKLGEMYELAEAVALEKFKGILPEKLKMPFKDGDVERPDYYKGHIWVTSKSTVRPGVVDQQMTMVTPDNPEFYAGCYCRATVQLFAYDQMGNRGVSMGLQNIQIVGRGDAFTMRRAAEDDFTPVTDEEQPEIGGLESSSAPALFGNRGPGKGPEPVKPVATSAGKKMFG